MHRAGILGSDALIFSSPPSLLVVPAQSPLGSEPLIPELQKPLYLPSLSSQAILPSPAASGDATSTPLNPCFCVRPMSSCQVCLTSGLSHRRLRFQVPWPELPFCATGLFLRRGLPATVYSQWLLSSVSSYCHFPSSGSNICYLHQPPNGSSTCLNMFSIGPLRPLCKKTQTGIFLYLKTWNGSRAPQDELRSPM